MKFTEEKLEKAFTELLGQEGFPHHLGITITRKPEEVLIEADLQNFLLTQYAYQGITASEIYTIIHQLKTQSVIYKKLKIFIRKIKIY
jgi:type I restriction enzyme, R subunit